MTAGFLVASGAGEELGKIARTFLHHSPAGGSNLGDNLVLRLRIDILPICRWQFQRRLTGERHDRMPRRRPARFARAEVLAKPLQIAATLTHERIARAADFIMNGVRVHAVRLRSNGMECK